MKVIFAIQINLIVCVILAAVTPVAAQIASPKTDAHKKGSIIVKKFEAESIKGNRIGEESLRRITIYLPPGYNETKQRYPVVYFLHGGFDFPGDSVIQSWVHFEVLMDAAIAKGQIQPMIFVLPNSNTTFGTSIYTNSTLTGKWSDFIAKDVVKYIDANYRTLARKNSRGLSGHSLGGHGALKIAMLHPDVFGAVYALSPGLLNWGGDFAKEDPIFKRMDSFRDQYSIQEIFADVIQRNDFTKFRTKTIANLARAYSPDDDSTTFLRARIPFKSVGDSMVADPEILAKWDSNFPVNMIDNHLAALKSLIALKIDWGRNDQISNVIASSRDFSKKLEKNNIPHFAEEYMGDHFGQVGGPDGRINTELIPFFNKYLSFDKL